MVSFSSRTRRCAWAPVFSRRMVETQFLDGLSSKEEIVNLFFRLRFCEENSSCGFWNTHNTEINLLIDGNNNSEDKLILHLGRSLGSVVYIMLCQVRPPHGDCCQPTENNM